MGSVISDLAHCRCKESQEGIRKVGEPWQRARKGRTRRAEGGKKRLNERTLKSLEVLNLNRVRAEGSGSSG